MLASEKGRALTFLMPRDRILTESDGPFAQVDSRPALPWDTQRAVPALAAIWNEPEAAAEQRLLSNLRRLTVA